MPWDGRRVTFASCHWPSPPGAEDDGYGEVTASAVWVGPSSVDFVGATMFDTACGRLAIDFSYKRKGQQYCWGAFRVHHDQVHGLAGHVDNPKLERRS